MRIVITLGHSDTVSGTTIFDDGTKAYWTEGYSTTVVIAPNGRRHHIPAHARPDNYRAALAEMIELLNEGATPAGREMTLGEEIEWMVTRSRL